MAENSDSKGPQFQRMSKSELRDKMHALQESNQENNLQHLLHELEVYQIELEMQNRELRESRIELETSLDRYVNLYDFAPTGFATLDVNGRIIEINLTLARMLGIERQNLIDRSMSAWIFPSDVRIFRQHLAKCRKENVPQTTELRVLRLDQTTMFVEVKSAICENSLNQEMHFRTAFTDISVRKSAEAERDRFFELADDLLSFAGTDGYFKRVNPAWTKVTGYSKEELLSQPYLQFIHPDDRENISGQLPLMTESPKMTGVETRFIKKDRSIIWLTWKTVIANGVYYSIARNTSNEHFKYIEIENEQNWLREMIEKTPTDMILVEAETGKIISTSSGIQQFTEGLDAEFPYANQPGFVCEDKDGNVLKGENIPRIQAARGREFNGEQIVWRTPLVNYTMRIFSRNIPAKYGRPALALLSFQDISCLKQVESSLSEAVTKLEDERELRERFVSTLTHDLRTPLTAIKMGSQLVLKQPQNVKTVSFLATQVLQNVDRLDHMISDLLDANRISAGELLPIKKRKCNLVSIISLTLTDLCTIHGPRFKFTDISECPAYLDPIAVRRVLENICSNAVKYGAKEKPISLSISKTAQVISISVHNEGPAIPFDEQGKIFNSYHRTSTAQASGKRGWGIGMTLIRGIAESHGGSVNLISNEAEGTTFIVNFPQAVD